MSEDKSTIEKTLAPQQSLVFDSHSHPGLEKKGIKDRPGLPGFLVWGLGRIPNHDRSQGRFGRSQSFQSHPYGRGMPGLVRGRGGTDSGCFGRGGHRLQRIHGITDPYPGNPQGWKWYVQTNTLRKSLSMRIRVDSRQSAAFMPVTGGRPQWRWSSRPYECGFPGIKIHTPTIGYPNNPDLYPAYEKCQELGMHVQIHTGVEELPGTRAKVSGSSIRRRCGHGFSEDEDTPASLRRLQQSQDRALELHKTRKRLHRHHHTPPDLDAYEILLGPGAPALPRDHDAG